MVTIGLIGLGAGAEPHAKSLLDLRDRVVVKAAASRTEARTTPFAARFGFPVTTNIGAVIDDPSIDAVIVLTPAAAHLEIAERCLRAGKHVLVEKPLELTVERAEHLVQAGRRAGRRVAVCLQHRFRTASVRLRRAIDAGELGEITSAWMLVPWWRPQAYYDEPGRGTMARDGGGVLMTQAIHKLDLFRSLVGVRQVVAAQVVRTAAQLCRTEKQIEIAERIEITGTRGMASLVGGTLRLSMIGGSEEIVAEEGSMGSGANVMDFPHDAHRAVLVDFLDAIEQNRDPVVTGEEALATQRLIADILKTAGWAG